MGLIVYAVYFVLGALLLPFAPLVVWIGGYFRPDWRNDWPARFGFAPRRADRPIVVWCSSVGEVNTAQRLVRALLAAGRAPVLLAVYTPAGLRRARELFPGVAATHAPLDSLPATWLWLRRVRPRATLLFETEIWPAFIFTAARSGGRVALVNGRLSDRAFPRYRRLRWFWRPALRRLDVVAVQTAEFAARFRELGAFAERVRVAGSFKFDIEPPAPPPATIRAVYDAFVAGRRPLVAGSTHDPEEKIAAEALRALRAEFPDAALIVAPRHVERAEQVAAVVREAGLTVARRSTAAPAQAAQADVLLLDVIGELSWAYSLGEAAFVGGSFGDRGGQNMLEPAAAGVAVVIGPRTPNFQLEAATLQAAGGLLVIARPEDLAPALSGLLRDPVRRAAMAAAAKEAVAAHRGAADRTARLVLDDPRSGNFP